MEPEPTVAAIIIEYVSKYRRGLWRFYYQDNVHFCYNARGSLEETLSHLIFAFEVDFIPETLYKELEAEGEEIDKMLNGYIGYLKKNKQGANEPGANYAIREETKPYDIEPLKGLEDPDETTL